MYKELQVVRATRQLSDNVEKGNEGTVVYVYENSSCMYEVEFVDKEGQTMDVLTVKEEDIEGMESKVNDEVAGKRTLLENKKVILLTCIPYAIILFIAVYYGGIVGFRWMESYCDGLYGFVGALEIMGLLFVATPLGIPVFACIIYHVLCIVYHIRKGLK